MIEDVCLLNFRWISLMKISLINEDTNILKNNSKKVLKMKRKSSLKEKKGEKNQYFHFKRLFCLKMSNYAIRLIS